MNTVHKNDIASLQERADERVTYLANLLLNSDDATLESFFEKSAFSFESI